MSLESMILQGISENLSVEKKQSLVLQLAEKLGIGDQICTTQTAVAIAERKVREAAAAPIKEGQVVQTAQGDARAVFVSDSDLATIRRVLDVAKAA